MVQNKVGGGNKIAREHNLFNREDLRLGGMKPGPTASEHWSPNPDEVEPDNIPLNQHWGLPPSLIIRFSRPQKHLTANHSGAILPSIMGAFDPD